MNLRLFNLFGRYERPDRLIPYLVRTLDAGGVAELSVADNVRDFTDVDVVSGAFELALGAASGAANRLYHIGTGRGARIADVAAYVAEVTGGGDRIRYRSAETVDSNVPIQVADITRARRELGWAPPDDLADRVRRVAGWWLRRGDSGNAPDDGPRANARADAGQGTPTPQSATRGGE